MERTRMKQSVYVLLNRYKDDDIQILGIYTSKRAMILEFADVIRNDWKWLVGDDDHAAEVASLRTAELLSADGLDGSDECRLGETVYWYDERPLTEISGEEDGDDGEDDEE